MPETTEKYLRVPQHPGKNYTDTRTGTLSASEGIHVLYGKAPGGGTWEIRTLLFRRDYGWTWKKVRTWIKGHKQFSMPESLQEEDLDELFAEISLNTAGVSHANSLIAAGNVNRTAAWSFDKAADGDALLGEENWDRYKTWFLALDTSATPKTKDYYKYPFGKHGKVYRSALIAIRQRAGQQGATAIFEAAGRLLAKIDKSEAHQELPPDLYADLVGVEVFRPGIWKGIPYENEDMDRIAGNSNAMLPHFQAKLKLTHDEDQPAFIRNASVGIASNYYTQVKNGLKRVYADFRNVPTVLAKAIEQFYPGRSVEKYRYFPHPDTKEPIPDVIKNVAFLGHMPPEVKGMFNDFAVLYDEAEQDRSEVIDCYEWRVVDDPTDDVPTQDLLLTPGESPDGEAPPEEDSKEESMPEDKKILMQEQTTETNSPDQPVSVEEEMKSSDAQPIQQTVTVNVPDTPHPQGFSEEDLEKAREEAKQAALEQYKEEQAKVQAELDQYKEDNATLKAEKFEQEVDHYLESLNLPESFQKLGVKAFLMRLDREQTEQFAEDGQEESMFDHMKAILDETSKFWEVTAETLSSEQAPGQPDRRQNQEQQQAQLYKEIREEHPKLPESEIMKIAADRNPELFEEEQEEVG